jgi:multisubunit Na+/H+ antiporter MnhF subunit
MNDSNPYAPPKAPVSDVVEPRPPSAPPHVQTACQLMWISLALQALDGVIGLFSSPGLTTMIAVFVSVFFVLIGLGIGYLILRWITGKLLAGRNWMRWLITVLNALSWLSVAFFWDFYKIVLAPTFASPVSAVSFLVQSALGIAAIVLLHTAQSRDFFRDN